MNPIRLIPLVFSFPASSFSLPLYVGFSALHGTQILFPRTSSPNLIIGTFGRPELSLPIDSRPLPAIIPLLLGLLILQGQRVHLPISCLDVYLNSIVRTQVPDAITGSISFAIVRRSGLEL